jgi:hypothetical protein
MTQGGSFPTYLSPLQKSLDILAGLPDTARLASRVLERRSAIPDGNRAMNRIAAVPG